MILESKQNLLCIFRNFLRISMQLRTFQLKIEMENMKKKGGLTAGPHLPVGAGPARPPPLLCPVRAGAHRGALGARARRLLAGRPAAQRWRPARRGPRTRSPRGGGARRGDAAAALQTRAAAAGGGGLRRSGGGGLRRPRGGAEQAPVRPGGPRARGRGPRAGAGSSGGVRSEGGGAFRGGARQTGGGGCGFGRGEVRGGRVGCGRAHLGLDLGGEDLGEEARRRGVEFGKNSNGGRDGNVRFGRDSAQTGTGWSGDGGRQGCWALDAANRGGAASHGRRDERRRLELVLCAAARERDRDGLNGSFQASAR